MGNRILALSLYQTQKSNLQYIIYLNMEAKTINLLEERINENLMSLGYAKVS